MAEVYEVKAWHTFVQTGRGLALKEELVKISSWIRIGAQCPTFLILEFTHL